ncbi:MAG: hypothetical protein LBQ91_03715 [Oscillospiraceae bacterium]|jgi:hypothetical protein|nr:hypothetical protein [Oscillospiraceae bacterium]
MKQDKIRHILTALVFAAILGAVFVTRLAAASPQLIASERRPAAKLEELTAASLISGKYTGSFEDFAADSFPFRETMRKLHSRVVFSVFRQTDKGGLYLGESGAGKFQEINADEYRKIAAKIQTVADTWLYDMNVRLCVIPDKSVFAGSWYPGFEPGAAARIFAEALPNMRQLDISGALASGDFYRTDLHWNQARLAPVLAALGSELTGDPWVIDAAQTRTVGEFSGVYPGQLALPVAPDTATIIEAPHVTAEYLLGTGSFIPGPVYDDGTGAQYDFAALYNLKTAGESHGFLSIDPYNLFLCGPQMIIRLTNAENAGSGRHLYIFRDSFSSSLAPLIAEYSGYETVTLVDLRYINARLLGEFVELVPGSDALFMYGSQIFGDASILMV